MATDRRTLVFDEGKDFTHEMLFQEPGETLSGSESDLVLSVCQRIGATARILAHRDRQKPGYVINDEYDVQDLLHATLRAVIKRSVQENPIGKVGGVRGSRADICVEELGILIEVKFARLPADQKRLVHEFSEDLVLYSGWHPLKILVFIVYNSGTLRDPEALLGLGGAKEIDGRRFEVKVLLP
jgi:hypothetical protein